MNAIRIEAEVGHDHRLIDELPPEVPVGRVTLVIQPATAPVYPIGQGLSREEARRRLLAAGKLLVGQVAPEGAVHSSELEHRRLVELFGQGPSSEALIDEDRGPRG